MKKNNNIVITFTISMKIFLEKQFFTRESVAWETAGRKTFQHSHILEGFVPKKNEKLG